MTSRMANFDSLAIWTTVINSTIVVSSVLVHLMVAGVLWSFRQVRSDISGLVDFHSTLRFGVDVAVLWVGTLSLVKM